jgi:hypothetical protein
LHPTWYPPGGGQDVKRLEAVPGEDREFGSFCLEFLASILKRRPDHVDALKVAAHYLTKLGYYADGLTLDRELAGLFPDDPVVLYNLACSLSLNGIADEAFAALETAVRKGYRDAGHLLDDEDLAFVRSDPRFPDFIGRILESVKGMDA